MFAALAVLGCRVRGLELSEAAGRRVARAVEAFATEGAELVITSGGRLWNGVSEAEAFAAELVRRGVPENKLLREHRSWTTRENASGVAELLRARGVSEVGVVTCDWHLPRALRLFQRVGLRPVGIAALSPPASATARLARAARERTSLALDLLLSRRDERR